MKSAISLIEGLDKQIGTALEACRTTKNKRKLIATLSSVSAASTDTVAWLKENEKRRYISVRKALTAVQNLCGGLVEGLSTDELTLGQLRTSLSTLAETFHPKISASLADELAAQGTSLAPEVLSPAQTDVKLQLSQSTELASALKVVTRAVKERQSSGEIGNLSDTLHLDAMSKSRENLPLRLKGEFQVIRMPVVPIFSNAALNTEANFKKLGLKFISVEGYAILLDQLLLNVSAAKAKAQGLKAVDYAKSVLSLMNERGSTEYALVSDNPTLNPRNTDLHMFWVLPLARVNVLMRVASASRTPTTMKWGLPF